MKKLINDIVYVVKLVIYQLTKFMNLSCSTIKTTNHVVKILHVNCVFSKKTTRLVPGLPVVLVCIESIKQTKNNDTLLNNLVVDIMDEPIIAKILLWIMKKKYSDPLSGKGLKRNKLKKSKK